LNVKILFFKKITISKTHKKIQNIMNKIPLSFSNSILSRSKVGIKIKTTIPSKIGKTPKITPKL
jgi:hypothetical protein